MRRRRKIGTIAKIVIGLIGFIFFFIIAVNFIHQINDKIELQRFINVESKVKADTSTIVVYEDITEENSKIIIGQLKSMAANQQIKEIELYLNSYGGSAIGGLAISKVMYEIDKPIIVYARMAASSASLILSAGTPGKRFISKNGLVFMHRLSPNLDKFKDSQELIKGYYRMQDFFAQRGYLTQQYIRQYVLYCHQTSKRIKRDMKKEAFFNAEQAIAYGFADHIF